MMIYPSYIIANIIGDGQMMRGRNKRSDRSQTHSLQILYLSFMSAAIMTVWDLVVDPYLSSPTEKAWIWEEVANTLEFPCITLVVGY